MHQQTPLIQAKALRKSYARSPDSASTEALSGVDFEASSGAFVALMGPSGSGKSTLLQILGGLDAPDSGEVFLEGIRYGGLADDDLTRLRNQRIGFVFQFFNLVPTLTAQENVMFPAILGGTRRLAARKRAQDLLHACGLSECADRFPETLSGGQQQRVAVARALINQPRLVLADEPTGSLDRTNGSEVLAILSGLAREQGTTIVMATHDADAGAAADQIVRLSDGRLVEARPGKAP